MINLNNIPSLGNSILQRPLTGALKNAATQSQQFYAQQPLLTQMAQEERMRQEQDGLLNVMGSRKKKLKDKAMQSPMLGLQASLPGMQNNVKNPGGPYG